MARAGSQGSSGKGEQAALSASRSRLTTVRGCEVGQTAYFSASYDGPQGTAEHMWLSPQPN